MISWDYPFIYNDFMLNKLREEVFHDNQIPLQKNDEQNEIDQIT